MPNQPSADELVAQAEKEALDALAKETETEIETEDENATIEETEADSEEETAQTGKEEAAPSNEVLDETAPTPNENEQVALSKQSARGENRYQDIVDKLKDQTKQSENLAKQVDELRNLLKSSSAAPRGNPQGQPTGNKGNPSFWDNPAAPNYANWSPEQIQEQNMTPEQLETLIDKRVADSKRKDKILGDLDTDIASVEEKYQELRPPTDGKPNSKFDKELVDWISETYRKVFSADQTVRLSDFTNRVMSVRKKGTEAGQRSAVTKLKQQAAEQAIDPSGSPAITKTDDLEAKIRNVTNAKELAEIERLLPHADR